MSWGKTRASVLVPTDAGARTSVGRRLPGRGELAGVHRVAGLRAPGAVRVGGGRPPDGAAAGAHRQREPRPEAPASAVDTRRLPAPAGTTRGARPGRPAPAHRRRDGGLRRPAEDGELMPGTLASLLIKLGLDATGVEQGVARTQQSLVGLSSGAGMAMRSRARSSAAACPSRPTAPSRWRSAPPASRPRPVPARRRRATSPTPSTPRRARRLVSMDDIATSRHAHPHRPRPDRRGGRRVARPRSSATSAPPDRARMPSSPSTTSSTPGT